MEGRARSSCRRTRRRWAAGRTASSICIEGDLDNAKYWYRRAHRPLPHGNTANAEIAALKATLKDGTQ